MCAASPPGLKGDIGAAASPDTLADLMAKWEEYELTRSNADVLAFARDKTKGSGSANDQEACWRVFREPL